MRTRHRWTEAEDACLREWWPTHDLPDFQHLLPGLTASAIYGRIYRLGILKSDVWKQANHARRAAQMRINALTKKAKFSPAEDAVLREHFADLPTKDLLPLMPGRSIKAIAARAKYIGIRKSDKRNAELALLRSAPIGTTVVNPEGYTMRKVKDTPRIHARFNWRREHILVWEAANGPVPKGSVVVFRNGDRADIRLENLELIPRSELTRRNSVHRLPEDVRQAISALGAMNKAINRINRRESQSGE